MGACRVSGKKRTNYTQRSLKHLRDQGYIAEVVEKWLPFFGGKKDGKGPPGHRKDLFGVIDILAIHKVSGHVVAAQSTSKGQINPHLKKIEASEHIDTLRLTDWQLVVHGWHKPGHRYELVEADFTEPTKYAATEAAPANGELF